MGATEADNYPLPPQPKENTYVRIYISGVGAKSSEKKSLPIFLPLISLWLTDSGGYVALNWINPTAVGRWDYVALCDHQPGGPSEYLTNQWTYTANQTSPFVTGTAATGTAYWIMYCTYDYEDKKYKILASAGPFNP